MKNLLRLASLLLFFSFALSGCYYDKENELYPSTSGCDTIVVTYGNSIKKIMVANCNICHSTANPSGNVVTENYDGMSVIAKNGKLWASVSWEGDPMPKGLDTLSICDRTKIKKWIDAGSPNN